VDFGLFEMFRQVYKTGIPRVHPISFYNDIRIAGWRENYVYKLQSGEIVAIYEDVTEQKRTEQELKDLSRTLYQAMNIARMAPWEYDTKTGFFTFNDTFYAMLGTTVEQAGGYRMSADTFARRYTAHAYAHQVSETIHRVMEAKDPDFEITVEGELKRPDGSVFWVTTWLMAEHNENGTLVRLIGVNQDTTERKRMENALKESTNKLLLLTQINRHDIFNELTAMYLMYDLALDSDNLQEIYTQIHKTKEGLRRIERVIQFTREYDDFAYASSRWISVYDMVESVKNEVDMGEITLENSIPADLEIYAEVMVLKVFKALVENAIRHGETLTVIKVFSEKRERELIIVCEDDGIGIPSGEKDKIFQYGHGKHTGIGLFLAKEILSITGLTIREVGVETKGSTFEITVPASQWRIKTSE